ncbi:MAG: hypothetical protein ACI4JB_06695 [Porcipelethomonas sp.]
MNQALFTFRKNGDYTYTANYKDCIDEMYEITRKARVETALNDYAEINRKHNVTNREDIFFGA